MSGSAFVTLAKLRRLRGVTIPQVRQFERTDPSFPAVEWVGDRSGLIVLAEYDHWFATRDQRATRAREQERRRREFVGDSGPQPLPKFKRGLA